MLILKSPWESQPQSFVEIAQDNPITKGLLTAWTPATGDALRLGPYTNTVVTRRASQNSIVYAQAYSGGGYVDIPDLSSYISNQLTVAFVIKTDGTVDNGFGDMSTEAQSEHYPYSGVLYITGGASTRQAYTPTGINITLPHCTVISSNTTAGTQRAHIAGRLIGSASISALTWKTASRLFESTGYGGFGGEFAAFFAWNRALSDAEAREVSVNPWQLFAPLSKAIPLSIVSGGTYALNLETGVYSFTGSSATLSKNSLLTLDSGSYTLSGSNASLVKGVVLECSSGTYSLSGADAVLTYTHLLNAGSGSYSITGSDATLTYTPTAGAYVLNAETGAYTLLGQDVTFVYSGSDVTIKAGSWIRYRIIT